MVKSQNLTPSLIGSINDKVFLLTNHVNAYGLGNVFNRGYVDTVEKSLSPHGNIL